LVKRKDETSHEYYLRNKERLKEANRRHKEKYKNDLEYRKKHLSTQRNKKTLDVRTKTLQEIEELERQWPVSDNPDVTANMTERERMIMLAALIIGEGSISIYKQIKGVKYPQYLATITLTNTDFDILELFKILFKESNYVKAHTEIEFPKWRPAIRFSVYKQRLVIEYLIKIRPFLVGRKRKIADIMIDVIKYRLTQPNDEWGRMIVPDIDKKIEEIRELNRRGRLVDNE
jgi:hypothetical protein